MAFLNSLGMLKLFYRIRTLQYYSFNCKIPFRKQSNSRIITNMSILKIQTLNRMKERNAILIKIIYILVQVCIMQLKYLVNLSFKNSPFYPSISLTNYLSISLATKNEVFSTIRVSPPVRTSVRDS